MKINNFFRNIKIYALTVLILLCFVFINSLLYSADGDIINIRTIEFGKEKKGMFIFPKQSEKFYKVTMNYHLKCPCAEWDYLAYVFVEQPYNSNFLLDGAVYDSIKVMFDTSWTYKSSVINNQVVVDSTANPSKKLLLFKDKNNPGKLSDSMFVWSTYYRYQFDENGNPIDSNLVEADTTIYLSKIKTVLKNQYSSIDEFEIFRYITPYGNGLSLGDDGYTWKIDVTDFVTLLHDTVYINAPNTQEDLELTFDFIKGTPPRDIVNFRKMWYLHQDYHTDFENYTPEIEIKFAEQEKMARLKVTQTGHGFTDNNPCAEFCSKEAYIKVDNDTMYTQSIWRDDCGMNTVYPQGGTWNLSRSNWCPGDEVRFYDWELTPKISSNSTHILNYDMEYYDDPVSGFKPNYRIASFLITYSEPNYNNDVELLEILAPNSLKNYNRMNPVCGNPIIKIKNNGANTLNKLKIKYGIKGATQAEYNWTGELKFLETLDITLPTFEWGTVNQTNNVFTVELINPNDISDENKFNNSASSYFSWIDEHLNDIIIEIKTNKYASEQYNYTLRNVNGDVVASRNNMEDYTVYLDTVHLADGCYEFKFRNELFYGINCWFIRDNWGWGGGYVRLKRDAQVIKSFNGDFGEEIFYQFIAGPLPQITTSTDTLDFGDVNLDQKIQKAIKITPANRRGLFISEMSIGLGAKVGLNIIATNPSIGDDGINLAETDTMTVDIELTPVKAGSIKRFLNIQSNDKFNPTKQIMITANIIDPNSVDDNQFNNCSIDMDIMNNPCQNSTKLNIIAINNDSKIKLSLYNSLGILIKDIYNDYPYNTEMKIDLDVSELSSGMYYVILNDSKNTITKKLIIYK